MKNKIYRVAILVLLFVLFIIKPDIKSVLNPDLLKIYSLIFIAIVILHFITYDKKAKNKNWFRLDVFFLLGFGIVHFQWPIMYGISNIIPEVATRVWVDEQYVNYGTWLSTIGGISWILGFSFIKPKHLHEKNIYIFKYNRLLNFTILLFVLFLLTAGNDFLTGSVYKGAGGSAAGEGVSAYIQLLFSTSIILLTAIIIIDNKKRYDSNLFKWFFNFNRKFLILYFTYIILFLLIGDRGGPVFLLLTTATITGSIIRPLRLPMLIISIFVGSLFISIISLGRSEKSGIEIISTGAQKLEYSSGYDNTVELANSVRTLYMSISEVPDNHDFFYGKLWIGDLLSPIPFGQSLYIQLSNTPYYELGSSSFITYLTFGLNPYSGEGTSLIADIYLNFGVLGIVFFMFLLGLFFKKTDNGLKSYNINWIIVYAFLASASLSFGRNPIFFMARPIIWSFILMYIFVKIRKVKT